MTENEKRNPVKEEILRLLENMSEEHIRLLYVVALEFSK